MPDTTGMTGITSMTGTNDALSLLSNAATRVSGANGVKQPGGNGPDFTTVIDATAMAVMASAQIAPQAQAGAAVTPPMVTETRSYNTVEITTRSAAPRGNDYARETGMAGTKRAGAEGRTDTESAFDGKLDAAFSDAGAQMQEEAAERLDVTEEQIAFAMRQTGLLPVDLLTEDGLTTLVTEVAGVDPTALITDGALYADLQALVEAADALKGEIVSEFEMTPEGVEEMLALLTEEDGTRMAKEPVTAEAPAEETARVFAFAEHAGESVTLVNNVSTEGRAAAPEDGEEAVAETDADFSQRVAEDRSQLPEAKTAQDNSRQGQEGANGQGTQGNGTAKAAVPEGDRNTAAAVSAAEGFVNAVNEAVVQAQPVYGSGQPVPTQAQDILRQIVEQMRTDVRPGVTELDMQLNPQSLGRVNVNLQSLDGGEVVARFTAQNEAVRDAIAAQMPQLLQRFEEQGIKVSEVQVAVAEHGFDDARDRNMNREDRQREQEATIARAGRMRRVQMDLANMTADDIANLTDDERVEAEMMAAEGNTVNYRA